MAQLKDLLVMGPGRVIGDAFFGSKLMPTTTETQDIGSSTIKWNNIYGTLKGNADTASYPEGFDSRVSNDAWGNNTGTAVTEWKMTNGGKVGFKNNNPQTGLLSLFVNGRVYIGSSHPVPGLESSNSVWGLTDPDGATANTAIRTPANGLYPYQPSNSTTAYSSLGAEGWYFNTAYIKTIYGSLNGTISLTNTSIDNGDALVFIDSSNSNKITASSIKFDGSTENSFLSKSGTWQQIPVTLNGSTNASPSFYAPTAAGTKYGVLTSGGSNAAPTWNAGLKLTGTTTGAYVAHFYGTTDNTLDTSNTGSVIIDGGVAIAKNLTVKKGFSLGNSTDGMAFTSTDYLLSGGTTTLNTSNISTYFTINSTDETYPWSYDTTNNCWASMGATQDVHSINRVVMAQWTALSNFALVVNATVNAETGCDYLEILVNDIQKFTTKGSSTGVYTFSGTIALSTNDVVKFRLYKDGSANPTGEYYRAVLKRQSYSTPTVVKIIKDLVPNANNTYALGSVVNRWFKLYIGAADSYGSESQPIYWNNGVPKACDNFYTTLNNSKTSTPNFYAPTSAGTSGYYLKSNGSGSAPTWASLTITLNGTATTSPSFYAPTSAGTSGYYLKSNGSGIPSWVALPTASAGTAGIAKLGASGGAATYGHTHTTSVAKVTSGTSSVTLEYSAMYKITAGGTDTIITMPAGSAVTLNGTSTTSASFYAPTGAGTSGQYLKSSGSGAPSWSALPTASSSTSGIMKLGASGGAATYNHTHTTTIEKVTSGTSAVTLAYSSMYKITAGGTTTIFTMQGGSAITLNGTSTTSASFYAPTTAGTQYGVLTSGGSNTAPAWNLGLKLEGSAVDSYKAHFYGTTNNTLDSSDTGSVIIDGGVAIAKKLTVKSAFSLGDSTNGRVYTGSDYTLTGSATTLTNNNISTYFTVNSTDTTYPWSYDTTNTYWANMGTTQNIHNINVIMAQWTALSNFALMVDSMTNSERNYDYFQILVNDAVKFTTQSSSGGTGTSQISKTLFISANDVLKFRFVKDSSANATGEYYRAILKCQNYSSTNVIKIVKSLVPDANNSQTLGSPINRWSKLYIGSTDSYGSDSQPIYWDNGIPKVCTNLSVPPTVTITLNGSSTTSPSFYAPTASGNANQILISNGSGSAPTWTTVKIATGSSY